MKTLVVCDPTDFKEILRERRRCGGDRHDEVWDGVYVMAPNADNVHQSLTGNLVGAIYGALGPEANARVLPGGNITDRDEKWAKNYRVPDVAVFLAGNPAEDRGTHYLGGPDFAVEVISKRDRSREKFGFYARVGVRELLLIDRDPWALELYRLEDGVLRLVGRSDAGRPDVLTSAVLPLTFRLRPGDPRPAIEATRPADGRVWSI